MKQTETTTSEYKILQDSTISLNDGKLFILVTNENNQHYLEVHGTSSIIGRKEAKNYKQAKIMWDWFKQKLTEYEYLEQAEYSSRFCLSYETVNECMFALKVRDKETKYSNIKRIADYCHIELKIFFNEEEQGYPDRSISIHAYSPGKPNNIGIWRGEFLKENFKFHFNHRYK